MSTVSLSSYTRFCVGLLHTEPRRCHTEVRVFNVGTTFPENVCLPVLSSSVYLGRYTLMTRKKPFSVLGYYGFSWIGQKTGNMKKIFQTVISLILPVGSCYTIKCFHALCTPIRSFLIYINIRSSKEK